MNLLGFGISNFRSIINSGWIDTEDITTLVGTNESGKTNVLLPLWKLNPVNGGEIDTLADMPRSKFVEMRTEPEKYFFIKAKFLLNEDEKAELKSIVPTEPIESFSEIVVEKNYVGQMNIDFPNKVESNITHMRITELFNHDRISELDFISDEQSGAITTFRSKVDINDEQLDISQRIDSIIEKINSYNSPQNTVYNTEQQELLSEIGKRFINLRSEYAQRQLSENTEIFEWVCKNMPKFIYYSNYGNLDSRIRLSSVIAQLSSRDLDEKEKAKVRTLKTLFEFVGLSADEILNLGKEPNNKNADAITKDKSIRLSLLNSAGTKLTREFKEWWKQGNYIFRLSADGDFFRIIVSDTLRPEEIDLEARSAGLQWFFSFFLIFLNESTRENKNAILLLDEPGNTLHPTAQKDLFGFFQNLSKFNQLLYTTHSPFLVDSNNFEKVKSVYINKAGESVVSSNLRASEKEYGIDQTKSIFSIHAALGITVSDTLLVNCNSILVEGPSDAMYLTAIKNLLISKGKVTPLKEIIFIPTGGTKGIKVTASILSGKKEDYPFIVLDGDSAGHRKKKELEADFYKGNEGKIIDISKYSINNGEVEDLFPKKKFAAIIDKVLFKANESDESFEDIVDDNFPIIDQIDAFASRNQIDLGDQNAWKIELAKNIKKEILSGREKLISEEDKEFSELITLFKHLI